MNRYLLDTDINLYDLLNNISFYILLIFNLSQIKKKKELLSYPSQFARHKISTTSANKTLTSYVPWAIVETILISVVQYSFTAQINSFMGNITNTASNYFGLLFITPILLILFCTLLRINPLKQIDIITPAFPLALVFSKLACFSSGCCHGVYWEYGLYNETYSRLEFPVQLLEAGIALSIFVFLLFWRKKAKTGTLFPTYLIIYSVTRFFSEFTRGEQNVFGILKTYHILCIAGFIVGIIELFLVIKYSNNFLELLRKKFNEIYQQIIALLQKRKAKKRKTKTTLNNKAKRKYKPKKKNKSKKRNKAKAKKR